MKENLLASVVNIGGTGLELRLDGEENSRVKEYKCLESYVPSVGDRVLVIAISGTYLVMGRVVDAPVTTLEADTADRWATARTLSLTGSVTGSASISGASNVSMATSFSTSVPCTRSIRIQNQNSTGEGSDIYLRVVSNKLNFRVGAGGTWYVITSA